MGLLNNKGKIYMFKSKFNILFEEIMKTTISIDTFDFKFEVDENKNLTCSFESVNPENNKLIQIVAEIKTDGTVNFTIDDGKIEKMLTEKEFMLKYYSDYEQFKSALKDYNEEQNKTDDEELDISKLIVNNKHIPQINSFKQKLNKLKKKNAEQIINIR